MLYHRVQRVPFIRPVPQTKGWTGRFETEINLVRFAAVSRLLSTNIAAIVRITNIAFPSVHVKFYVFWHTKSQVTARFSIKPRKSAAFAFALASSSAFIPAASNGVDEFVPLLLE